MDKRNILKILRQVWVPVTVTVLTAAVVVASCKYLSPAVCYSVSKSKENIETAVEVINEGNPQHYPYENISDIPSFDEYRIAKNGKDVAVFDENGKALYRIHTRLDSFPEDDRKAIEEGIEIPGKRELCEIVSYMES